MTYIAAYRCQLGIVICADTLETVGDQKNYVEKLAIIEDQSYPLATAGAGVADLIDAATLEIVDRAKAAKPKTRNELENLIRMALVEVFEKDLPTLVVPKQHRSPEFLIAAKPSEDEFCIFHARGRRILGEQRKGIIGHPSVYNWDLLKRLHSESLSMQQGVMLATYLVAQSKRLDEGVGGETRVAVVVESGAWMDDPEYIENSENRVREFLEITDNLFFSSIDVSIAPAEFPAKLEEFTTKVAELRQKYLDYSAARTIQRMFGEREYSGEPYKKIFAGAKALVTPGLAVKVTDEPPNVPEIFRKTVAQQAQGGTPEIGYTDSPQDAPKEMQAVIEQNSKGLWEMKITSKGNG